MLDFLKISLVVSLALLDSTLSVFPAYASKAEVKREQKMDLKTKARFFQIENVNAHDAGFFDCLTQLWNHPDRTDYHEIFSDVRVRLERFSADDELPNFYDGEFVRQQTNNLPPLAHDSEELVGHNDPLGHRCAFRYHTVSGVVLLESKAQSVTPTRIEGLIRSRILGRVDKLDSQSLANMIQDSFCGGYNGAFVNGRERMAVL